LIKLACKLFAPAIETVRETLHISFIMPKVVVTGLGFITSIGNDQATVLQNLRDMQHGFAVYPPFDDPGIPVTLAGTLKDFDTQSTDPEDWTFPATYSIKREVLRGMSSHVLYGHCALTQAIADAGLTGDQVSHPDTGLFTASAGSTRMLHHQMNRLFTAGVMRCSPLGIVASVTGTLSFNLVAAHKIIGSSAGFASACASSGHALGYAYDEIKLGRQKRILVVGGEDGNLESILPFAGMRALSPSQTPATASRPFDAHRDGFVGTGGAVAMVLEDAATARARGANLYAEVAGWGHAADGYNVAISHPEGEGLVRAMQQALLHSEVAPEDIDYINAHATSTPIGDRSEIRAIKQVFGRGAPPAVSSTKALTGHGLSMASIMEAAFTVLAMQQNFTPGSAHIETLDPEASDLNIIRKNLSHGPRIALSNSSGFGGANVALIFKQPDA